MAMNLICGINPVLEALSSGDRHFDRLLIAKGLRNRRISEAISRASRLAIPLRFETRETLDRMAGAVPHQGLIAVVSPRPASTLEDLLATARDPPLFVVLDGVEDPRNLGAILRSAEAAGCDGVLLPDRHNAGLSETVNRASAGALEHVRLARIGNVVQSLEALKARGVWVVGFDAAGTERWDAVDYRRPVALVLGGEGKGMRRLVREHCDHLVSLPLFGHVASLNVSVAAGIALYEVIRQRGLVPSQVKPIPVRPAGPARVVGPPSDDGERDPGAHGPSAPEGDDDNGFEDDPDVQVVTLHEDEAAWAGPTVLKPVEFRRGRPRPGGRGHNRDGGREGRQDRDGRHGREGGHRHDRKGGGRRRDRDLPPGPGAAPPDAEAPAHRRDLDEPEGRRPPDSEPKRDSGSRERRGRRRRRRGGGGGGRPQGGPVAGSSTPTPGMSGPPAPGGPPATPGGGGAPGGGNRRRRRRRRGRPDPRPSGS
jgi:23S rRNA (guanosine2251-2'-O)-methyltransferase